MSKHTPLPWLMICTDKAVEEHRNALPIEDKHGRLIALVSHDLTVLNIDEYTANAELIARAPKLLEENEQLKAILKDVEKAPLSLSSWVEAAKRRESQLKKLQSTNSKLLEALKRAVKELEYTPCDPDFEEMEYLRSTITESE